MVPTVVFIVPYRDREEQRRIFEKEMKEYLEYIELENYEFYFICQQDTRKFNRGAMKNLGFLYVKHKYPDDYKNISLAFNDVDTFPTKESNIKFETTEGIIAHYYGFNFALGGLFVIKGGDFEKTTGFPNYWCWGLEDNCLQNRAIKVGLKIDRTIFYGLVFNTMSNYKYITRTDKNESLVKTLSDYEIEYFRGELFNGGFKEVQKVNTDVKIIDNKNTNVNIYYFECEIDYNKSIEGEFKQNFNRSTKININPFARMFYM